MAFISPIYTFVLEDLILVYIFLAGTSFLGQFDGYFWGILENLGLHDGNVSWAAGINIPCLFSQIGSGYNFGCFYIFILWKSIYSWKSTIYLLQLFI